MSRVKAKYPTSQCFLKQDKLYVDNRCFIFTFCIVPNRMFVWNLEEGRVTEQMVVTIPATPGNLFPGLNVQNRCTPPDPSTAPQAGVPCHPDPGVLLS